MRNNDARPIIQKKKGTNTVTENRLDQIHAEGKRLLMLRAKLAARLDRPGLEKNCEAIIAEIARIEHLTLCENPDAR